MTCNEKDVLRRRLIRAVLNESPASWERRELEFHIKHCRRCNPYPWTPRWYHYAVGLAIAIALYWVVAL